MSAFWNKNKKDDNDDNIEQDWNYMQVEEDKESDDAEQTQRLSRSEYRKLQNAKKSAKTFAHRKVAAKDALSSIFLRYILPPFVIYIIYIGYQYVAENVLVKLFDKPFFWILHIVFLSFFVAVIFKALSYMFDRLPRISNYFGAIAWFVSIYFYVTFLTNHDAKGPILAAMILFVTGVIQLTNMNKRIKGIFILLGTIYGNYLTSLDFPNVWLVLGVGGLFVLMRKRGEQQVTE